MSTSVENREVGFRPLVGNPAPLFKAPTYLPNGTHGELSLAELRGQWVALVFYPLDFTFVCPTELKALAEKIGEFKAREVHVLGVSVDSTYAHEAWVKGSLGPVGFPLVSDSTHEISRRYGVLIEKEGIALRATVLIDPEGIVRSYAVNDLAVGRSMDELLRTVDAFRTGELCPAGWSKGKKTLGKA